MREIKESWTALAESLGALVECAAKGKPLLTLDLRPHRTVVATNSSHAQKLFVAIRLGLDASTLASLKQAHVSTVVAVDTSGSMYARVGEDSSKIELAIEAITAIGRVPGLENQVHVGIVQFDTKASTLLPLTMIGPESVKQIGEKASELRQFGGGTNTAQALTLLKNELAGAPEDHIQKAILITDGETTDAEECLRLADQLAENGISLICIGVGNDYNEDFLTGLAERTNGFLYHLSETRESLARLSNTIEETLVGFQNELVTDVRLRFELAADVHLNSLRQVYPMVQEWVSPQGGEWRLGNVRADEETVVLADLNMPERPEGPASLGGVVVRYCVPTADLVDKVVISELKVDYVSDQSQAIQIDEHVVFFVRQARIADFVEQAVLFTHQGKLAEAEENMLAVSRLSEKVGNSAVGRTIRRATIELRDRATILPDTAKSLKVGAKTLTILSPPTKLDQP